MAKKKSKLQTLLSNARARTFVIFFGSIILIVAIVAYFKTRPVVDPLEKAGSQSTRVPQQIKSVPGHEVSQKYKELTQAENERRAQEAIKQSSSAIPTIIGAIADEDKDERSGVSIDDALQSKDNKKPTFQLGSAEQSGFIGQGLFQSGKGRSVELQEKRLQAQRERLDEQRKQRESQTRQQQERIASDKRAQEYQQSVQKQSQQMAASTQKLASDWGAVVPQEYVQGQFSSELQSKINPKTSTGESTNSEGKPALTGIDGKNSGKDNDNVKKRIIKAGTILFAVLDTSINTDVDSPVLATIVHGKLKGAKLIGAFKFGPRDEALKLEFTTLSMPKEETSHSVSIVAVDADTAKTALEGDLDKHYFVRYGTLFATSFMEGYASAISGQGTTTTSPLTGATTETKPSLSGTEEFYTALGTVGQKWGQAIQPLVERPYTIKIEEGTGIGLLFLQDSDVTPKGTSGK
jgi:hypothetical protein